MTLPADLADALTQGATILTASQRPARAIRQAYNGARQAAGETLWQPPAVLALPTWLQSLWHALVLEGHETRVLLSRTQECALWRDIIGGDAEAPNTESLAQLAATAYGMLLRHNGNAWAPEFGMSVDTRAFSRWAGAFERRCQREGFLAEAGLAAALGQALAAGTVKIPDGGVALVDFDRLAPAHAEFFESVERAGYRVLRMQTAAAKPAVEVYAAVDDSDEIELAARFVLEQPKGSRVAVVVPNLTDRRTAIDRVFGRILAPAHERIEAAEQGVYEFSLGIPLSDTAYGATALTLLRWLGEALPLEVVSGLLVAPHFGGARGPLAEQTLRAASFDAYGLRRTRLLRPLFSIEAFAALYPDARLQRLVVPAATTYAGYAEGFRQLLADVLPTPTDSLEYQTQGRFQNALDELATLDLTAIQTTFPEALGALRRIASETIFATESKDAQVQILGPLELGGVPFDMLWFLSADDLTWPPAVATNPLIPWQLQRSLGMLDPVAQLTERLAGSASEVVFSYGVRADEGERRLSPAVQVLEKKDAFTFCTFVLNLPVMKTLGLSGGGGWYADTTVLPPLPDSVIRGGAKILELQAACPFRAFAEIRLHASELETRGLGFDPRDRGELVHAVMEAFWEKVETQDALRAMPIRRRDAWLGECIDQALRKAVEGAQTRWDDAYLAAQRQRLADLLTPWLALELERPNFAVASQEKALRDVPLGPLRMDLRVDRIDLTAAGPLILDYKTGEAKPSQWLTDRPEAPQLPLYAVLAQVDANAEPLAGVAFAVLRAGQDLCLEGFSDSSSVLAKSSRMEAATFDEQVNQWRETLTALAMDFAAGDARVNPKSYPHTCKHCAQRIFCRLDPTTLDRVDDEAEQGVPGTVHG